MKNHINLNNYRKEICPYGLFVRYYDNNNTIRHEIYQDSTTKTFTIFNQQGNEIIYESYYKGTLQSKTYTKYNKQNKITTIQNQDPTQSQTKYSYYKNKYTQKITNNNQTTTITFNNQNKPISTLHPDKSIIYHTEKGDLLITNNFHFLDELYTDEKNILRLGRQITKKEANKLIQSLINKN